MNRPARVELRFGSSRGRLARLTNPRLLRPFDSVDDGIDFDE